VQVVLLPFKDGVNVIVAIAGFDTEHNEKLRESIRTGMAEGIVDPQ